MAKTSINSQRSKNLKKTLKAQLEKDAIEARNILFADAKDILYEKTDENLYNDMNEGDAYIRTLGFLFSISGHKVNEKGKYKAVVYFNPKKMKPVKSSASLKKKYGRHLLGQHMNYYNENITERLTEWLEEGHTVPHGGTDRPGAHMIEDTYDVLRNRDDGIKAYLNKKSNGVSITKKVKGS